MKSAAEIYPSEPLLLNVLFEETTKANMTISRQYPSMIPFNDQCYSSRSTRFSTNTNEFAIIIRYHSRQTTDRDERLSNVQTTWYLRGRLWKRFLRQCRTGSEKIGFELDPIKYESLAFVAV